ncbi:MAG: lysophospholipid acyltransferase family protein [Bacteroidota bacterium]
MAIFFVIFIIPLTICALFNSLHRVGLWINFLWAKGFFRLAFFPVDEEWQFKPDKNQQYILCANHFSYLDIPALALFPRPFKFVGKSQLAQIPFFGIMYKKIHITVDRANYKSRAASLQKARKQLRNGYSLGFFPEGGIVSEKLPEVAPFKYGAFNLSTEAQVPIVPVTFLDNYKILADDEIMNIRRRPCRIIYHAPIFPEGHSEEAVKVLREKVHQTIQQALEQDAAVVAENQI